MKKESKFTKFFNSKPYRIVSTIIKVILYIVLFCMLAIILVQRFSNNLTVGGIRIYSVASGSMEPVYKIGDILVDKEVSAKDLNVGDDVTYLGKVGSAKGLTITHRIVDKELRDGKWYFLTKGLANKYEDHEISEDQIYGKTIYRIKTLSFISRLMVKTKWYFIISIIVCFIFSLQLTQYIVDRREEKLSIIEEGNKKDEDIDIPKYK